MIKKFSKNKILIFFALFIFAFLFYIDSFKHFFYQDDIWHFYISRVNSIKDFLDFFNPINKFGYQIYRPLSTQVVFLAFQSIFGINHTIFQLLLILLFSVNAFLIYEILNKYSKSSFAFLLSIFYIIHHQNIGIIYYLSTVQLSIALLFTLLSIRQIQEKQGKWQLKVFIFYLLSIFSQEISLLNSAIFSSILLVENWENLKSQKKLIFALLFTTLVYVIFRFYFLNQQVFTNDHYQISLNPKTMLNNLLWYSLWMMSVPEYVINFVGSGFKPLPPLFGQYRLESIMTLIILLTNFTVFATFLSKIKDKRIFVYLLAFVFSLAPVLVFPWHKYVYHLPIASVFILIFFSKIITKTKKDKIYYLLIVLLLISAAFSNFIDRTNSYNYKRGVTARIFLEKINWPDLTTGSKTIFIANDPTFEVFAKDWGSTSSQAKIVLKENLFFTIISKNDQIKAVYEDDLKNLDNLNYDYKITAKKEW